MTTTTTSTDTTTTSTNPAPALEQPGGSWWDVVGATVNRGLNRWIDVEVWQRSGGQLTPEWLNVPAGARPTNPTTNPAPAAADWLQRNWLLLAGVGLAFVLLTRSGKS